MKRTIPNYFLFITFLFRYDYISLLDIDEVMVPLQHDNWSNMMDAIVNQSIQVRFGKVASWLNGISS